MTSAHSWKPTQDFYPRSPRGERLAQMFQLLDKALHFYPRSPRGERHPSWEFHQLMVDFYPRSPRGERLLDKVVLTT